MKTLIASLSLILLLAGSCKKAPTEHTDAMTATVPLLYQIYDKSGNNIFALQIKGTDSVMLSGNNGAFYDQMQQPADSSTQALMIKKYNGVIISDNRIARYNNPGGVGANLQNTFSISYHGQNLGVIKFQLKQQHTSWAEAAVFTLNDIPAKLDSSAGIPIYKLQSQ